MENYTSAGGAHTIAAHVPPTATQTQAWANCTKCHKESDHQPGAGSFLPSSNIKVSIDQNFKFNKDRTLKYEMDKTDGAAHQPGKCSNVSCHFQKTPKW
jgi:hypothetical protein